MVIGLLAVAAPAAVVFEWETATEPGPIGGGNVPTGYSSWDLMMTVDTNIAVIQMYIQSDSPAAGDFYQDPFGSTSHWTPNPAVITGIPAPDLEFDTYCTLPVAGSVIASAVNIVPGVRPLTFDDQLLDVAWSVQTATYSGAGKFHVARVTVKDGLTGTWRVWGTEIANPVVPYSDSGVGPLFLPEPATLLVLLGGALLAIRRRR